VLAAAQPALAADMWNSAQLMGIFPWPDSQDRLAGFEFFLLENPVYARSHTATLKGAARTQTVSPIAT